MTKYTRSKESGRTVLTREDGLRIRRVHGKGPKGGIVYGWHIFSSDGRLLADWLPTADDCKRTIARFGY